MSQLTPANHPHNADPSAPVVEPGFEIALHVFWEKNRNLILMSCAAVLVGILAWKGMEYFAEQRERDIRSEYARISDQPTRLAAFAEAHSGHALAGVALLQLADDKFSSGDYTVAAAAYGKAAAVLKNGALLGRAKLGAAVSQLSANDRTGGEAALKTLSADTGLLKHVRAEATYHLATLAAEAGNTAELGKLVDQISKIDASGPWSQRATILLAGQSTGSGKPVDNAGAGVTFKTGK